MKVFIYESESELLISEIVWRFLVGKHRYACIRTFHTVQDARAFCEGRGKVVRDTVTKAYTGKTPEGREAQKAAIRGEKNPNSGGLSEAHKQKIARTMRKRRGEFHHMYNMKHRARSKMKTSLTMRKLPKRRWAVDAEGKEHFIFAHMELPERWIWGRKRGAGRRL